MRHSLIAAALVTVAGCGGSSSALEGIYTVDAWNMNPASCADPGPSVLATMEPMFYVKMDSFFGQSFLNVVGCNDMAECSTMANDGDTLHLGRFILDQGNDDDGWTGKTSFSFGPDTSNVCMGGVSTAVLTADGEAAFQVRDETVDVPSFPPQGTECTTEDAEAAAVGLPCTSLELVHATFLTDF